MPTSKEYMDFILSQCPEGATCRAMMGEYVVYFQGKVVGGVYDERLLVKPVPGAVEMTKNPRMEIPYPGAKELLAVDEVDDKDFLAALFPVLYDQLPAPKPKKPKKKE